LQGVSKELIKLEVQNSSSEELLQWDFLSAFGTIDQRGRQPVLQVRAKVTARCSRK
jgi:hypothetical protein